MEQMKKLLARLSLGQKISIAAVAVLVAAALVGLAQWRHEEDFRPLYTGLAAEDAGAVVQKLKESGTEYRLSGTAPQCWRLRPGSPNCACNWPPAVCPKAAAWALSYSIRAASG